LLSYGADVNAMTDDRHDYRTVLHYAVLSGNHETVNLLLKQGARAYYPPEISKPTTLDLAILRGDPHLVKLLLLAGKYPCFKIILNLKVKRILCVFPHS
jgi:ankyrin repeat protein